MFRKKVYLHLHELNISQECDSSTLEMEVIRSYKTSVKRELRGAIFQRMASFVATAVRTYLKSYTLKV
jgi:hypothetical protein